MTMRRTNDDLVPANVGPLRDRTKEEEEEEHPLMKQVDLMEKHKKEGNLHYAAKEYETAISSYRAGLEACACTDDDDSKVSSLTVALRSNLAVTLLKVCNYQQALQECNLALELDATNPKVWYRRGLAREGLANARETKNGDDRENLCKQALRDFQTCLWHITSGGGSNGGAAEEETKIATMKRAALAAQTRMQHRLLQQQHQQQQQQVDDTTTTPTSNTEEVQSNGNGSTVATDTINGGNHYYPANNHNPTTTTTIAPFPPPVSQQRRDVIQLLTANNNPFRSIVQDEAYFLIDWNWWCRWCQRVDFFQQAKSNQQQQEEEATALQLLPPGAILPEYCIAKRPKNDNDERSSTAGSHSSKSSSSSSSSSSKATDDNHAQDEEPTAPPLAEIDNSALFQVNHYSNHNKNTPLSYTKLKPNLVRGHHYELVPREVYNALKIWYGQVTPSICRRVQVHHDIAKLPIYTDFDVNGMVSRNQVDNSAAAATTAERTLQQQCGACQAPSATCRCGRCFQTFYCGRSCQESHFPFHKQICKQLALQPETAQTTATPNHNRGRVGLSNLGNTCFMNSALQCLSHATPLTRHFLSNKYKKDVNTTNPLGTGGKLATAYEAVLKDIWLKPGIASTSPTDLKRAIAQFAPRFAGCAQHDAQEFLAYLLDGLHEDLNRVRKPPYVEMPQVGQDMAIAGAKAWDAHQRRNDSLVMDTFYGQFKSTCVCPKCNRVSVSFDAFNHVALEIPPQQELDRVIPVLLIRAPTDDETGSVKMPQRYGVTVKRGGFAVDVRKELSDLSGIPTNRLHICDVYDHAIFEILKDNKPVSSIRGNDVLAAYELPPYDDEIIHAVATHALVSKEMDGADKQMDVHVATELEASAELSPEAASLEPFSFPFMTAFDLHSTCRQVWDHMWKTVTNVAAPEFVARVKEGGDTEECLKSLLRIRIVDNLGKARPVFLDDIDSSNILGVDEEMDRASILPPTSDNELMTYLGRDCASSFLFVRLEWMDNTPTNGTNVNKDEEKVNAVRAAFHKDSLFRFENHASLTDALQKFRQAQGNTGVTLDKCFETFTKPERLDEHNMWYCSQCKEHVRAMKTMQLWRLPNILVITLKRFEFKHILRRDKLDTLVDFPLDGLDMSKHCAYSARTNGDSFVQDSVPAVYDLFGVTNHYGRMGFGHYTAFARRWDENGMSNDWALFDDASVQSVGDGRGVNGRNGIVSPAAYILFYRRRTFH